MTYVSFHKIVIGILVIFIAAILFQYKSKLYKIPTYIPYIALLLLFIFAYAKPKYEPFQLVLQPSNCTQYQKQVEDIIYMRDPSGGVFSTTGYFFNVDVKDPRKNNYGWRDTIALHIDIMKTLFKTYNINCWKYFIEHLMWMMNCNSIIFPSMKKANNIKSLATPKDRRNNFKELMKQPEFVWMQQENVRFIEGKMAVVGEGTRKPGINFMFIPTMWETLQRITNILAMFIIIRVNIPETEIEIHKDMDDLAVWFEKIGYFMYESYPADNNMGIIQQVFIMMAKLMNCRKLKINSEQFMAYMRYNVNYENAPTPNPFDTTPFNVIPPLMVNNPLKTSESRPMTDDDRKKLYGFIWCESHRQYKVLNYQTFYLRISWVAMLILKITKTEFNTDLIKVNVEKAIRNGYAEQILKEAYTAKKLSLPQFSQIMQNYINKNGDNVITLDALLNEINSSNPQPSSECSAPSPVLTSTSSDICTTYKTKQCNYYTPFTMKVLIFFTTLRNIAKYGSVMNPSVCIDPSITGVSRDREWYKHFFENGPQPKYLSSGIVEVNMDDFREAIEKWVGTETSVFP